MRKFLSGLILGLSISCVTAVVLSFAFDSKQTEIEKNYKKKYTKVIKSNQNLTGILMRLKDVIQEENAKDIPYAEMIYTLKNEVISDIIKFKKEQEYLNQLEEAMSNNFTFVVFGLDSRNMKALRGLSDVNIIVNVNLKTAEVKLISLYRDTLVRISDTGEYDKLNAAYARYGVKSAIKTINENFDLDLDTYVTFTWLTTSNVIDILGGTEIIVTPEEFKYMNAYIHETCLSTGKGAENPAQYYIANPGYNRLNGIQTVAYCRLRYGDSDYRRTERQREVIKQLLNKVKELDVNKIKKIVETLTTQLDYNIYQADLTRLVFLIKDMNIVTSIGLPDQRYRTGKKLANVGDAVSPNTLEDNVRILHREIYGLEYEVSSTVERISKEIQIKLNEKVE